MVTQLSTPKKGLKGSGAELTPGRVIVQRRVPHRVGATHAVYSMPLSTENASRVGSRLLCSPEHNAVGWRSGAHAWTVQRRGPMPTWFEVNPFPWKDPRARKLRA